MENQSNEAPVAAAAAAEVSSTTSSLTAQPVEPTKRSLRVQTWKKIQEGKVGIGFNGIFNRIPAFVDADKAAALLTQEEEFKKAQHIKVTIDRALHDFKEQSLLANKSVYLPSTRDSSALCLKVEVPADATDEQKKESLRVQDIQKFRSEINLDSKLKLDMVVIGSVVVSRDGYRIGRGNGFADLDIGLLIELGAITPETAIVTIVHDVQVVDTLPVNLFQKYDSPVDIIVTPTEVIRVSKRLPRPNGVFWELLSERRLKILPVLQQLKEQLEKSGKTITLKEEDTDVEQHQNSRRRRGPLRRRFQRGNPGRTTSQTDNEQQGENAQKRAPRRKGRFINRRRRTNKSEGDQSGVEVGAKSEDRKFNEAGTGGERRPKRKNRPPRDFCVKLSNLTRDIRVKDLKTELRKRECNPLAITWKGHFGKCFLHFGNRNGGPSTQEDVDKVLKSLNDLSLTITTGGGGGESSAPAAGAEEPPAENANAAVQTKTINLSVELLKFGAKKNEGGNANNAGEEGDNNATNAANSSPVNGATAAGGEASGAAGSRIESVDTTTV
ncbi:methenyltetrahydrofolate synthase domain-containing protein isoform X2 [Drosophila innubila]|uniref:methenyltetrahydrofolate synthase domain-containing protein isoform X2 n=1 Tax=Drosophila innubila TaxID=198719 RepID=UPI00148D6E80|nr:methenyltetrahydrofolate synthase domain-containing protein isoform X2 [Drosophila innubila]